FVALEDRPSPAGDRLGFVVAVPGKLDGRPAVALALPVVDAALDDTELELALPVLPELDEGRLVFLFVHVPLRQRDDVPAALERGFRFRLGHDRSSWVGGAPSSV